MKKKSNFILIVKQGLIRIFRKLQIKINSTELIFKWHLKIYSLPILQKKIIIVENDGKGIVTCLIDEVIYLISGKKFSL